MKIKFKNVIVISLIFTILFSMLPTLSFGAEYDEESAVEAYITALDVCARDCKEANTEEKEQEAQFDCLKKILDIWYNTGDNASTITVETTTETDDEGNTQTKYSLSDGSPTGAVTRIFNLDIYTALQGRTVTVITSDGKQIDMPAGEYLNGIKGQATNQIYGRNEESLENHLINKIDPSLNLDTKYVSLDEVRNTNGLETIGMMLTGIAKIVYQPLKWIVFLLPGGIIQLVIEGIADLDGGSSGIATLDKILFNKVKVTNANIFDASNAGENMGKIRDGIASWYIAIRNLSIVISLCMLIYIGIRMAISSIAEKKAGYKEMLKNWFMGMVILFLLHYFMVFILNINDQLVKIIESTMTGSSSHTELVLQLLENSLKINIIKSTAAAICFIMLQGLTFGYLIMYVKRMLTISLLTCTAPLITATYAMDKVGDKKSQVLNTWIKEYAYNVLMQPFHCIIYVVFVQNAIDILAEAPTSFAAAIIAIMSMSFMIISEGIVKAIFGLQANTMGSAASSIAAFAGGATVAANISQSLNGKIKNAKQRIEGNIKTTNEMAKKMPKTANKVDNKNTTIGEKARNLGGKAVQGAGKVAGVAKKLYLNPRITGIQAAMISGALGLATGDESAALHSGLAGQKAGETLGAHMSEMDKRRQVSRNEAMFERDFDEYQIANPGTDMKAAAAQILAGGKVPKGMEHFAASTLGLRETYKAEGKEDPIQAVLDNIDNLKKYE